EMPPYRRPQLGKVLVRSIFDRTLFVLGRSAAVAAPAGLVLWVMANARLGDATLLAHVAGFLSPFAEWFGMDGMILTAFILGFPANEIVIPIIMMGYAGEGALVELGDLSQARELFVQNGWTPVTALCVLVFFLMHWPCSTTLWTVKKETGSWKWTTLSALIPTLCGLLLCFLIRSVATLLGIG
ncbi:MAG: ferrous iron transport protein B, partial [Clostridia bacterium]|nr:ferrous iron transport protein B [Clostridia bacterium]